MAILVYYFQTPDEKLQMKRKLDLDQIVEDFLKDLKDEIKCEEKEFDPSEILKAFKGKVNEYNKKMEESFPSINTYPTLQDVFKAFAIDGPPRVEELEGGFYKVNDFTMKFFQLGKKDSLQLKPKEKIIEWVLK